MNPKEIFIIDSHAYLYRNYYALPKLTSPSGEEVGALYGFTRLLLKILKEKRPEFFAVCYDSPVKTFRDELYSAYKANRPKTDEALIKQINLSREIARGLGLKEIMAEGYEADDIIASLSRKAALEGYKVVIISGDKDLTQLVSGDILLWEPGEKEYRGGDYVMNKFGLPPEKIKDYLALVGDSSDNIPGVRGIGPKTAVKLIEKYGSAEKIIEKAMADAQEKDLDKIKEHLEDLKLSKKLVELNAALPFELKPEDFRVASPKPGELKPLAERFRFRELVALSGTAAPGSKAPGTAADGGGQGELFGAQPVSPVFEELELEAFLGREKAYVSFEPGKNLLFHEKNFAPYPGAEPLRGLLASPLPKYFYKLKDFMREKGGGLEFKNCHDIYIAYHLCHGGERKPELARIAAENSDAGYGGEEGFLYAFYFREIASRLLSLLEEKGLSGLYGKVEMPLVEVLCAMENNGMLLDIPRLKELSSVFEERVNAVKEEFARVSGSDLNLNSPKQLSHFIYEKLSLPIDEKQKKMFKTKTGYTTSEEALKFLAPMNPAIGLVLKHRELVKLKNTFIDPLLEKADASGRIRTNFDQTGTQTGRLSSSDPNLQNIPVKSEYGQLIRSCFTAREGFLLLSADYSQIDLRVMAHLSGDENLCRAFHSGEDIHLRTARQIFGLAPEKVDEGVRRIAKTINFGIIYGQTPMGLSRELGISFEDAEKYIGDYFRAYAGVKKWIAETAEYAKKNGYVKNFAGRMRYIPDINSPNRNLRLFSERMAVNMPVQSGSSDIIKKAMVEIHAAIKGKDGIRMISQIHDELLFEIRESEAAGFAPFLKKTMEGAFRLSVPLKVEIKAGKNWSEMERLKAQG